MPRNNLLTALTGGDRRSIGQADRVAARVSKDARLFPELIAGMWSDDPLVRMRAADAAEKVTRGNPELLQPFKKQLSELDGRDFGTRAALASGGDGSTATVEHEGSSKPLRL